jgi:hypothetical protein
MDGWIPGMEYSYKYLKYAAMEKPPACGLGMGLTTLHPKK